MTPTREPSAVQAAMLLARVDGPAAAGRFTAAGKYAHESTCTLEIRSVVTMPDSAPPEHSPEITYSNFQLSSSEGGAMHGHLWQPGTDRGLRSLSSLPALPSIARSVSALFTTRTPFIRC